jgi:Tfp pilus assembly protein PilV
MTMPSVKSEGGFGLIELLIAMVVLQVGLLVVVGAFGAGSVALATASHVNTAAMLADQRMEMYRAMPYDAIGLDTTASTTSTYTLDTGVCPTGQTPTCGNTTPRNNSSPSTGTWSCTATSGSTSVSLYFTTNGVNPCTPQRTVSAASSPDGHPYEVDTYIRWLSLITAQRAAKQVSVVVRDGSHKTRELAKEVTTFDCSTGSPTNTTC